MIEDIKGSIHSTESFGAVDGPGIRFVVFFQGCPLRCLYCHNPDSWKFSDGKVMTAGKLIQSILSYHNFIKSGGVTLSGGDPLAQPEFACALLTLCKQHRIHTAVDTSGFIPLEQSRQAIDLADMLLLDIKDLDPEGCIKLTGQSIDNTLATLDYCEQTKKPVWLRHVCVPGYTLIEEKLIRLADYLKDFTCIERVELIPFHQMGEYKWNYIDTPYQLSHVDPPSQKEMAHAVSLFRQRGLPV